MILAGDIGGTHCRLAVLDKNGGVLVERTFPSRQYGEFRGLLRSFVETQEKPIRAACLGVPGPVRSGRCKVTNLPWELDAAELAQATGIPSVRLINDLQAHAYGIEALRADEIHVLSRGESDPLGNRAVIAAGTGLGEAGLVWTERGWLAIPSEGGHTDFGPTNELEVDFLRYMRRTFRRVSYELILSGPGLIRIYDFLRERRPSDEPSWLADEMRVHDPAAVISRVGREGSCSLCVQALEMFVSIYGAEAGNLALKFLATGGVYLAGGIAPAILDVLRQPAFLTSFAGGEKMRWLLESIPVMLIRNDKAALLGAGRFALNTLHA